MIVGAHAMIHDQNPKMHWIFLHDIFNASFQGSAKYIFLTLFAFLIGCTPPTVLVERPTLEKSAYFTGEKTKILAFDIQSDAIPEESTNDVNFMSGTDHVILFRGQARDFIRRDLEDYLNDRFIISADSDIILTITISKAVSFFKYHKSAANWIPFIGIGVALAEGGQQVPVTFDISFDVKTSGNNMKSFKTTIGVVRTESVTAWSGTTERHREIYKGQYNAIRKELFTKLDSQVLTLWKNGIYQGRSEATN
jgi:hypothetical protein